MWVDVVARRTNLSGQPHYHSLLRNLRASWQRGGRGLIQPQRWNVFAYTLCASWLAECLPPPVVASLSYTWYTCFIPSQSVPRVPLCVHQTAPVASQSPAATMNLTLSSDGCSAAPLRASAFRGSSKNRVSEFQRRSHPQSRGKNFSSLAWGPTYLCPDELFVGQPQDTMDRRGVLQKYSGEIFQKDSSHRSATAPSPLGGPTIGVEHVSQLMVRGKNTARTHGETGVKLHWQIDLLEDQKSTARGHTASRRKRDPLPPFPGGCSLARLAICGGQDLWTDWRGEVQHWKAGDPIKAPLAVSYLSSAVRILSFDCCVFSFACCDRSSLPSSFPADDRTRDLPMKQASRVCPRLLSLLLPGCSR